MQPTPNPDRREFAVGLAALAAGLVAPAALADDPKPAEAPDLAKTIENLVRLRFGPHLTDEQLKKVTQRVNGQSATATALKRVPLTNGDEPAFVFQVD